MLNKPSKKEGDETRKSYNKWFKREGYDGNSIEVLTTIFYFGLNSELKVQTGVV
jgi:hypothetical protein